MITVCALHIMMYLLNPVLSDSSNFQKLSLFREKWLMWAPPKKHTHNIFLCLLSFHLFLLSFLSFFSSLPIIFPLCVFFNISLPLLVLSKFLSFNLNRTFSAVSHPSRLFTLILEKKSFFPLNLFHLQNFVQKFLH